MLFLTQGPIEDASARHRVYQYLPALERRGMRCTVAPAVPSRRYCLVFRRSLRERIELLVRTIASRVSLVWQLRRYDVVLVQREVIVRLFPLFELMIAKSGVRMIFDYDDNIFANPVRATPAWYRIAMRLLQDPKAPQRIISWSDAVIAGSPFLAIQAQKYNRSVFVVPTVVDLKRYQMKQHVQLKQLTVGWVGSPSSSGYLTLIKDALFRLAASVDFRLLLIGAADRDAEAFRELPSVQIRRWRLDEEAGSLLELDVGVMPLTDDIWAQGKCGFKAIQYMAAGVPTVCSPVGANRAIIDHGTTGLFAATEDDWVRHLTDLLGDVALRRKIGYAARRAVEARFSVEAWVNDYAAILAGSTKPGIAQA